MTTKYHKIADGSAIQLNPQTDIMRLACCDCGLVHEYWINVETKKKIRVSIRQLPKPTAQLRRHNYGKLQKTKTGWRMYNEKSSR